MLLCVTGWASPAETHVKATLLANVSAIEPAKPFKIGVLLEIDPDWHIYWTNPGDSGMATSVKFTLPAGYTVTPDPFPVPRRITQPGNETIYGYENAVLLSAMVTPPKDAKVGDEVAMSAACSWLVCKEACMPGKATANLTLKVADKAEPANAITFEQIASTVVPAGQKSADVTEVQSAIDDKTRMATITIHWKGAVTDIELFPGADDAVAVSKIAVAKAGNDATSITLKRDILAGQKPLADHLPVLIAYKDAKGATRGFETTVPLK
jgi:thiol:disulfide interchange protein DsbD